MISIVDTKLSIEGPVLGAGGFERRRLEIQLPSGLITHCGAPAGGADIELDDDCRVFPGCIDFHVHAREDSTGRENYKETFRSAGEAAIHGGVVAIADMPNNPSPPVDDASYVQKRQLTANAPVDILLYAGVGPGTRPLSFPAPYKVYMGPSVGPLFFEDGAALRETLAHYRGQWVAFHAEDPEILRRSKGAKNHWERRPPEAEAAAVATAIELAREFQFHAHICHLSTAAGLQHIQKARRLGYSVSCEVTPHHLSLDLESMGHHKRPGFLQCNPPLRPRQDRLALLEAFRQGEIDFLASDHAPHSLEENERGIPGMPHLDTFGPFLFWLQEQNVTWHTISKATSDRPGKVMSRFLSNRYGRIAEGYVGSLTVLNTQMPITIRRGQLKTAAGWSPFEGQTYSGSVSHTIVRGKVYPAAEA